MSRDNFTTYSQRMPTHVHAQATALAKERGSTLTHYVNQAVEMAVKRDTALAVAVETGPLSEYLLSLRFALDGAGSDGRATRLLSQISGLTDLAGADVSTAELVRVVPIPERMSAKG